MELLLGFLSSFFILLFGLYKGIYIGFCVFTSLLIFTLIALRQGHSFRDIRRRALNSAKKSLVVIRVFILIGLVTASWLTAGTIPAIVYYALRIMNPRFFVLFSFITSCLVSYMLGTSLGTASTIGIVLIIMARTGDINLNLVGGAILGGCYFGDRCSPMSSSANLISNLTGTKFYPMLKNFRRTTLMPLIISILIYFLFSINNPLNTAESTILDDLSNYFTINFIVLLPAVVMLILSIFQINVRKSMFLSAVMGSIIALTIQRVELMSLARNLIFGFSLDDSNSLSGILRGGGLLSMIKPGIVIFISCAMVGVLEEMGIFEKTYQVFKGVKSRSQLFKATAISSFISAAFGGNQSIAVVMVNSIMEKIYQRLEVDNYQLATDISNTAIVISPMIPWNIANFVIANNLGLNPALIVPYAFYLFILPIYNYIHLAKSERNS